MSWPPLSPLATPVLLFAFVFTSLCVCVCVRARARARASKRAEFVSQKVDHTSVSNGRCVQAL